MDEYELGVTEFHGQQVPILLRKSDHRAVALPLIDMIMDLTHDHPHIAGPLFAMLEEMKETKEFRRGVQA